MKKVLLLIAITLLSGCATEAKYKSNMDSWVGADEAKLIRKWGPPVSIYEAGSSKFLLYTSRNTLVLPGGPTTATTNVYGNTAFTTVNHGAPAQGIDYVCSTTLEVRDAKVIGWSSQGNGCVAE